MGPLIIIIRLLYTLPLFDKMNIQKGGGGGKAAAKGAWDLIPFRNFEYARKLLEAEMKTTRVQ